MSKTLLVVDDSSTIQEAVRHVLVGEDWTVITAADEAEAVEAVNSSSPDAALCDVVLGDEDGYDVCRILKAVGDGSLPIIMMGAQVRDTMAMAAGASAIIGKPFGSDELLNSLNSVMEQSVASFDLDDFKNLDIVEGEVESASAEAADETEPPESAEAPEVPEIQESHEIVLESYDEAPDMPETSEMESAYEVPEIQESHEIVLESYDEAPDMPEAPEMQAAPEVPEPPEVPESFEALEILEPAEAPAFEAAFELAPEPETEGHVEIIDLSGNDDFEHLELLDDLEPVEVEAVEPTSLSIEELPQSEAYEIEGNIESGKSRESGRHEAVAFISPAEESAQGGDGEIEGYDFGDLMRAFDIGEFLANGSGEAVSKEPSEAESGEAVESIESDDGFDVELTAEKIDAAMEPEETAEELPAAEAFGVPESPEPSEYDVEPPELPLEGETGMEELELESPEEMQQEMEIQGIKIEISGEEDESLELMEEAEPLELMEEAEAAGEPGEEEFAQEVDEDFGEEFEEEPEEEMEEDWDAELQPEPEEELYEEVSEVSQSDAVPTDALAEKIAACARESITGALKESLSPERLTSVIEATVERVVWEVVPILAERLISEALDKLQQEAPPASEEED